jgi:hypothetical protein
VTVPYPEFDGSQPCASTDPEAWFPTKYMSQENRLARNLCNRCDFKEPCLTYALYYRVDGIWGGTVPSERNRIRKTRNIIPEPLYLSVA